MKRCKMCGCILDDKHDSDICECCIDDIIYCFSSEDYEKLGV